MPVSTCGRACMIGGCSCGCLGRSEPNRLPGPGVMASAQQSDAEAPRYPLRHLAAPPPPPLFPSGCRRHFCCLSRPCGSATCGPRVGVSLFLPAFLLQCACSLSLSPPNPHSGPENPCVMVLGMDTPGVCMNTCKSARMSACGACELCCGICVYDVYVRAWVCACVPVQ